MPGSQKSSPSKNCPLTRARYRKMVSKSKGKRSPVKGRTSPISGVTGSSSQLKTSRKPNKKEIVFSKLSEEEQVQKVLEVSRIESMSQDDQLKLAIAASLRDLLNIPGNQNVLSAPTIPVIQVTGPSPIMPIPSPGKPMANEMPKEKSKEMPKELSKEKPKDMSQKMSHEIPQAIKEMSNISEIGTSMKNGNGRSPTLKELNKRIALYNERQNMQKWKMDSQQSILNIRENTPEKEIPENPNSDYSGKLKN